MGWPYHWRTFLAMLHCALQWRHNGRDSFSNHQPHDCLLNRLFRRRSKKTSKLRVTGLCAGNSPHKWPVTRKMFPFDDVIMVLVNIDTGCRLLPYRRQAITLTDYFLSIYHTHLHITLRHITSHHITWNPGNTTKTGIKIQGLPFSLKKGPSVFALISTKIHFPQKF